MTDHSVIVGGGLTASLKMTWADGMVGVLPVFDSVEAAMKYTGDKDITLLKMKMGPL